MSFRLFAFLFLAVAGLHAAETAPGDELVDAGAPVTVPYAPRWTEEFSLGHLAWKTSGPLEGWTKNFRKNPIPYRIELATMTWTRPLVAPGIESRWRNFDFMTSLVWSQVTRGPENHWGGVAFGFRYHYRFSARLPLRAFVSYQGGIGAIDSSGQHYAQETDLTFTYLAALGVHADLTSRWGLNLQVIGQHISNGWQTHPSEGIDCSGFSLGFTYGG